MVVSCQFYAYVKLTRFMINKATMSDISSEDSFSIDDVRNNEIIHEMIYFRSLVDAPQQEVVIDVQEETEPPASPSLDPSSPSWHSILRGVFVSNDIVGLIADGKDPSCTRKVAAEILGFMAQSGFIIMSLVATIIIAILNRNLVRFKQTVMILTIINIAVLFLQTLISKMGVASSIVKERRERDEQQRKRDEAQRKRDDERHRVLLNAILANNMYVPPNVQQFMSTVNSTIDTRLDEYRLDKHYDLYQFLTDAEKDHTASIE